MHFFKGQKHLDSTVFDSNGMMRKPDGSNGASSGNISSIGAKTSSEQAPTALSSTPLQICQNKTQTILRCYYNMAIFLFLKTYNFMAQNNQLQKVAN